MEAISTHTAALLALLKRIFLQNTQPGPTTHSRGWKVKGFSLFSAFIFLIGANAWGQNKDSNTDSSIKRLPSRSKMSKDWEKTGIYGGYTPEDEILEKRTKNTKHFRNNNGSTTVQIGDIMHYQDENGLWQDIDLKIQNSNTFDGYGFSNETNEFKSYFPTNSISQGVKMKLAGGGSLEFWKDKKISFIDENGLVNVNDISQSQGLLNGNKLIYHNTYEGFDEELELQLHGIENNHIIRSLSQNFQSLSDLSKVEFSQTIDLTSGYVCKVNGIDQNGIFQAKSFSIILPESGEEIFLDPIVIFDAALTKEIALKLLRSPIEKLSNEELIFKEQHILTSDYFVECLNGSITIRYSLPINWIKEQYREFPITIDPTVGTTSNSSYYGASLSHWYGYQRFGYVYLNSEIGEYGQISSIDFYLRSNSTNRTKAAKVYLSQTPSSQLSSGLTWNSATLTGGGSLLYNSNLTTNGTFGWQSITLSSNFNYSSGNLVVMTYDAFTGSGSYQDISNTNSGANRNVYYLQDNSDPGDAVTTTIGNGYATIRINIACTPQSTYYSKSTGNLNDLSTWGSNANGTGCPPANFTTAGVTYNVHNNAAPTTSGAWTVSGAGSIVKIGNGSSTTTFLAGGNLSFDCDLEITGNATLNLNTRNMTLSGDFIRSASTAGFSQTANDDPAGSTVTFSGSSQNINVTSNNGTTPTDSDITFNHVTISGSDVKLFYFKNNDRKLNINNLTVNSGKVVTLYSNPQP
ncbi:MAG: hypothetical protein ACK5FX_00260 [Flavobacteriia bacterium]|jgi:hypothetical protein